MTLRFKLLGLALFVIEALLSGAVLWAQVNPDRAPWPGSLCLQGLYLVSSIALAIYLTAVFIHYMLAWRK